MDTKATGPVEISYQNIYNSETPTIIKCIHYANGNELFLIWDLSGYYVIITYGQFDICKTADSLEIYKSRILYKFGTDHFVCEFYFNVLHDLMRSNMDPLKFPPSYYKTNVTNEAAWIAFFIRSWLAELAPDLSRGWQQIPAWEELPNRLPSLKDEPNTPEPDI